VTSGAEAVARALREEGVERLFLFPGGTIAPTLNAWIDGGGAFVVARHEQGAGYAALAAGRLTGRPGVAMVTSGPGVTNLLTVIGDAWYDSTPLVAIAGQVSTADLRGRPDVRQRGFQEVPTASLVAGIAKACLRPMQPDEAAPALREAFALARAGRPGPVLVDLPMDVQRGELSRPALAPRARAPAPPREPSEPDFAALLELLERSRRPLLLAGQGVLQSGAMEPLRGLAERLAAPVVTSLLGVGALPADHPLHFGYVGHTGCGWANRALVACDLLLVLGARLDVRQTGTRTEAFVPNGSLVRVDLDEAELRQPRVEAALSIRADAGAVLRRLLAEEHDPPKAERESWLAALARWRREMPLDDFPPGAGCHPAELLRRVDRLTRGEELVVATGVGHHQQWAARHLSFAAPRRVLLTSGGHGAMGYDLPSAVGAAFARPGARVLCVVGDGSFQVNMQELGTIAEHRLPVKILVLDNRRLAMVSQFQNLAFGRDPSTGRRPAFDFAGFARLYGFPAFSLAGEGDPVEETLVRFLAAEGPALLHARVDPACDISPMLLSGQTLDAMWRWNA